MCATSLSHLMHVEVKCLCVLRHGRRLLAHTSRVHVHMSVPTEETAAYIESRLTRSELNWRLAAAGLPHASAVGAPLVQAGQEAAGAARQDLKFVIPVTLVVEAVNDPPDFEIRIPRGSELAVEEDSSCITRSPPSASTFLTFLARPGGRRARASTGLARSECLRAQAC